MNINNLIIEVTRKCNFSCEHCLRGNKQNKNIDLEAIDALFNNDIQYISTVTFTGGEPSLNIEAIDYFIEKCKEHNTEIESFYIATNGGITSGKMEFLQVLIKLFCFCTGNEISSCEISKSDFHDWQNEDAISQLKCLAFVRERENLDYKNLIHEGKAKELNEANGTIDDARRITPDKTLNIEDDTIENDYLYINVHGDVILECDLSYARQTRHKIGNIKETRLEDMAKQKVLI